MKLLSSLFIASVAAQSATQTTAPITTSGYCSAGFNVYFVCDNSGSVGNAMQTFGVDFLESMIHGLYANELFQTAIIYFSSGYTIQLDLTDDNAAMDATLTRLRNVNSESSTYIDEGLHQAKRMIEREMCPNAQALMDLDNNGDFSNPRTQSDYDNCFAEAQGEVPISLVFLLSDGATSLIEWARYEANDIMAYGGYVFSLGIAGADMNQLETLSSAPAAMFTLDVTNYEALVATAPLLLDEFCLELSDVNILFETCQVGGVLAQTNTTFIARGTGFNASYLVNPQITCSFTTLDTGIHTHYPGVLLSDNEIECFFDVLTMPDLGVITSNSSYPANVTYDFEVSLDGRAYTRSSTLAILSFPACPSDPTGGSSVITDGDVGDDQGIVLDEGGLIGLIVGLAALLLFLIWFFLPLMCGTPAKPPVVTKPVIAATSTVAAPVAAPAPVPMEQPAAGKWKVVDTSSYIWATSGGGAAPMKTQWGNLGATAMAPTLNAQSTVVEGPAAPVQPVKTAAPTPAQSTTDYQPAAADSSCCGCWANCYAKCAGMRPQRASVSSV